MTNNYQQISPLPETNNGFASGPENLHSIMSGPVVDIEGYITHHQAVLSWIPATSVHPIIRYEVYRGEDPNNIWKIDETTAETYVDNTIQPNMFYFYYVIAYNSMNIASPSSNIAPVIVQD